MSLLVWCLGALPIQDVRSIILEKSQIHTSGLSEDLQSLCPSVRELHLGGNRIAQWDVVSINNSGDRRRVIVTI